MTTSTIALNDGHVIPQLGFGVWQVSVDSTAQMVTIALESGYRSIDTARIYENEAGVGAALAATSIPRKELFITTKLWNSSQGYDATLSAFDASMQRLGLDYLDLYLIHWPAPSKNLYVESWRAMIELQKQGRIRSIGVSNFQVSHLQRIIDETGVVPAINQIELHPRFQQAALREFHQRHTIATEAWSPLGQAQFFNDATIAALAKKHGRSPAQIILRWHLDGGFIAIPKSATPARIRENFNVFDFKLDVDDMRAIRALDSADGRIGPNPDTAAF